MNERLRFDLLRRGAAAVLALAGGLAIASGVESAPDREGELLGRIRAEIGEARCSSNAQCRTLAIGSRPCGGPAGWLAWSGDEARAARLKPLAEAHAAASRERQAAAGMMGTCQVLPEPSAVCRAGRCVLEPGAGGGPAAR